MGRNSILKKKSFDFAVRVIRLYSYLKKKHSEYIVAQQIVRSGTAIGALIREAEYAESRKDFIHKLHISIKEASECVYWLELLYATGFINNNMFDSMIYDANELLKMLTASIKTMKSKEVFSK